MNILDKTGLATLWEKIKSKMILSDSVRKIVIVEEYPEIEEKGVLYLKRSAETSDSGEEEKPSMTNLYYQEQIKSGGSESSGYTYNFYTNNTFEVDSCGKALAKDKDKQSNSFKLNLVQGKTYEILFKYLSGTVEGTTSSIINLRLFNYDTSTILTQTSATDLNDVKITYTAEKTESINAQVGFYIYSGRTYNALTYEVAINEV